MSAYATSLDQLLSGKRLSTDENAAVFAAMLRGELTDAVIAATLTAWRILGESAAELVAGAQALRTHATPVSLPAAARPIIDNCGTGGDGSHSFNLSTAAAIVAASAGARVAKHGNRSVSSRCGSADLLFAAGLPATLSPTAASELLESTGFTFFFAPNFHPLLAKLAPVRRQLGVRTIFNLLGPLANPLVPEFQLIGVGDGAYLRPMAEALASLGIRRGLVVHARDGLDELSPAAITDAYMVQDRSLTPMTIDPQILGIQASRDDLAGGDATHNLHLLGRVLQDHPESRGLAEAVALNAGAVLWLAECAPDLAAGVALARAQISSKVAREYFQAWLQKARELAA